MGKENVDFNQMVQDHIKSIKEIEEKKETEENNKKTEFVKKIEIEKEENRNHPIFKKMREVAQSPELKNALRAYYEAKIKEERHWIHSEDSPFEIQVYDNNISDHEMENEPFGAILITIEYWHCTDFMGDDHSPVERSGDISFEIKYDKENGLTFDGKDSLDEAIENLAKLTALTIIKNKKMEKEKEEERIKTRPQRLEKYKQSLLKRKKEIGQGTAGEAMLTIVKKAFMLIDYGKYFTEQELKDLEDIENGKDLVNFK